MPLARDARALVFGYGVEGRSALAWLRRHGVSDVAVAAPERPADLDPSVPWRPDRAADALATRTLLIRSPGIKPGHPLLLEAERRSVPVTTATNLFLETARGSGVPVIGVTGSKGKSTTATLIHLALGEAGVASRLVGNIGAAALDALDGVLADRAVVVFEMSSYQTHDLTLGPATAVITRLFPEHLDWHGSAEAYYASKLNIARAQGTGDATLWNAADPELARRAPFGPARHVAYGAGDGIVFEGGAFRKGGRILFTDEGMLLRGLHNRHNACAALAAAEPYGVSAPHLARLLRRFAGLPHRLEDLGVHAGIRWLNDSISTAPEAAAAALEAFGDEVATYVGGGADRGFDFAPLARALVSRGIPHVLLVPPGAPRMLAAIEAFDPGAATRVRVCADLAEAVSEARRLTPPGRIVLFSPASPSYGAFRNFEERGDAFRGLVAGRAARP